MIDLKIIFPIILITGLLFGCTEIDSKKGAYAQNSYANLTFCNQLDQQENKSQCYAYLAIITQNKTVCDLLTNGAYRLDEYQKNCHRWLMFTNMTLEECKKLDLNSSKTCITYLAAYSKNTEICDELSQENAPENCYLLTAKMNRNPEFCDDLDKSSVVTMERAGEVLQQCIDGAKN